MSDKINSHICLRLSVYKSFHQAVKYGHQRNHILQDLTRLKPYISMKARKTENHFETGFDNQKPVCRKTGINIPVYVTVYCLLQKRKNFGPLTFLFKIILSNVCFPKCSFNFKTIIEMLYSLYQTWTFRALELLQRIAAKAIECMNVHLSVQVCE